MLKYTDTMVTFSEVPNRISLCVNISNCPIHCPDCHSKELWEDVGNPLDSSAIDNLIKNNDGCEVFVIMGGDSNPKDVNRIAKYVRNNYNIMTCWYSGRDVISPSVDLGNFDYIKLGPYIKERGGLDNPNTNQIFYEVSLLKEVDDKDNHLYGLENITDKFWRKK